MSTMAPARSAFAPPVPQTIEELGVSQSLVLDLVLRRLLLEGYSTLANLSNKLKLSMPVVDGAFRQLRSQLLLEVKGMQGNDYMFILSQAGKTLASDRFAVSQYAGSAPVCLKDYATATRIQSARVQVDRRSLRSAFGDLVITDRLLDQLGPALIS